MRRRRKAPLLATAALLVGCAALAPACSIGKGSGAVKGTLNVPDCWSGTFDLEPDFFAATPYRNSMLLRIQRGGDYATFTDGVAILIDDVGYIRPNPGANPPSPGHYGEPLKVGVSPEVTPPGVPVQAEADPPGVHFTLYLQHSCRTQNVALSAVEEATLIPGTENGCGATPPGPLLTCNGGDGGVTSVDAGTADGGSADGGAVSSGGIGRSTITFTSLFNNNPEEVSASERLNDGTFRVYLADPREVCPGGLGPPPPCRGYLEGNFRFFFERGRPAQAFP